MRARTSLALLVMGSALLSAVPASSAQPPRPDAIWARSTAGSHIVLDGILDEPAWALAESTIVRYGVDNGIPGSGWKDEGGHLPVDQTYATLKFLVDGNDLYVAFDIKDQSVGGSYMFNRLDGLLMAIKDHAALVDPPPADPVPVLPAPPAEYFYSWWYPVDTVLSTTPGLPPCFKGKWATEPCTQARTATEITNWDAKTYVHGLSNTDAVNDTGYTIEMKFALGPMGYDVTQTAGDVVEWNVSIYDADWNWDINLPKFSVNRSWWQSPWGNAAWYDEVHILAKPAVTINSGPLPAAPVDVLIPTAGGWPAPVINGSLNDAVWQYVPGFDIRWDDTALRESYGPVGKWRWGHFQPTVNARTARVRNPADATVKMFTKEDTLYIGFDVRDQVVQYHPLFDRWDGFIVTLTDRLLRGADRNLFNWRVSFQVGPTGALLARDKMPYLQDTLRAVLGGLQLKAGTIVDTVGTSPDQGYTAELAFDLTKFGYPHGLGDRVLFIGLDLLDGDSYTPFTDSYGTRTWWYQQYENECCPAFGFMDPATLVTAVETTGSPPDFALLGSVPNPFHSTTRVRYALPVPGEVTLEIYDVLGRQVSRRQLGLQSPGIHDAVIGREGLNTSVYLYRLKVTDPGSGAIRANLRGKIMFIK